MNKVGRQPNYSDYNQVYCDDIVQETWHYQNKNAGQKRHDGLYQEGIQMHASTPYRHHRYDSQAGPQRLSPRPEYQ
jgi:hypothetical protein